MTPPRRRTRGTRRKKELKDRLIQTRVPQGLESTLKEEAEKRRLSVSHLIRNVLEDAFQLVDDVVSGAGRIAEGSVVLAGQVAEDATRIAKSVRDAAESVREAESPPPKPPKVDESSPLASRGPVTDSPDQSNLRARSPKRRAVPEDVLGWQALVIHKPSACFSCGRELQRGDAAHLAFTAVPAPPLWLCADCFAKESVEA